MNLEGRSHFFITRVLIGLGVIFILLVYLSKASSIPDRFQNEILDTWHPIQITRLPPTKFGFSVALERGNNRQINSPPGWIYIGVRKKNVTKFNNFGNNDPHHEEPGSLWKCRLGNPIPDQDSCTSTEISPRTQPKLSNPVVLNRDIIPAGQNPQSEVFWGNYFGFSASSGRYFDPSQLLYASTVPKADGSGAVIIFTAANNKNLTIEPPENSFGSNFGSVLYSADFDRDGRDELLVGAPQRKEDSGHHDHGAVFVYKFNNQAAQRSEVVVGSASFGSAITSITFENEDNTEHVYLVVGAPSENLEHHKNSGAIYLYLYNRTSGLFGKYCQRITAAQFGGTLNGFGSSLSVPEDIDGYATPDLAVGACNYKTGQAFVLRTRPKIELESKLEVLLPTSVTPTETILRGTSKFLLRSCFKIKPMLGILPSKITIWTTLSFGDNDLIRLSDSTQGNDNITFMTENVDPYWKTWICNDNTTVVSTDKNGIGGNSSSDDLFSMSPLRFNQQVWYTGMDAQVSSPYIIQAQPTRGYRGSSDFDAFRPRLPSATRTSSELHVPISVKNCKASVCRPKISIQWSFLNSERNGIASFLLGSSPEIIMELRLKNTGETAERVSIHMKWNLRDVTESQAGERWLNKMCQQDESQTESRIFESCRLTDYIFTGQSKSISIRLNMTDLYAREPDRFDFTVTAQVCFGDTRIGSTPASVAHLDILVPPTSATVTGSTSKGFFRKCADYISEKKLNSTTELITSVTQSEESCRFYSPSLQTFTIKVKGASVQNAVAKFQIPVAWNNSHDNATILFRVSNPRIMHMNLPSNMTFLPDFICGKAPSSPYSFHPQEHFLGTLSHVPNLPVEKTAYQNEELQTLGRSRREARLIPENVIELRCGSEYECWDIECNVTKLKANISFDISFELYPVQAAIDNLLDKSNKSAISLISEGSVEIFPMSGNREAAVASTVLEKFIIQNPDPGKAPPRLGGDQTTVIVPVLLCAVFLVN